MLHLLRNAGIFHTRKYYRFLTLRMALKIKINPEPEVTLSLQLIQLFATELPQHELSRLETFSQTRALVLCLRGYLSVWSQSSLIFVWPWCTGSFYLTRQSGLWAGDVCDSSRGGLSEKALFNMSNASWDRAGTIVFGGGLERCQNLLHELIAMVTGACCAWQADISRAPWSWYHPMYMCINLHIFILYGGCFESIWGVVGHNIT